MEGANLARHGLLLVRGFYRDSVLVGRGVAILAPGAMWNTSDENIQGRNTIGTSEHFSGSTVVVSLSDLAVDLVNSLVAYCNSSTLF